MKVFLTILISFALVVSGISQTRSVIVNTSGVVQSPTNFWSADASNARTGLGLGSAATSSVTSFQPASLNLSNLSVNNAGSLTNLAASSIVGVLSLAHGGTGGTNASEARTSLQLGTAATNNASAFQASSLNLSNLSINNGGSLTNLQASSLVGTINITNIPTVTLDSITGVLSIAKGGTSATNAANARQNLGSTTVGDAVFVATNEAAARTAIGATIVGSSVFTAIDEAAARTALSLGSAATSAITSFQPSSAVLSNIALSNGGLLTNIQASSVIGAIAISKGGSGATTAGGARTNFGLGVTNDVTFFGVTANVGAFGTPAISLNDQGIVLFAGDDAIQFETNRIIFYEPIDLDSDVPNIAATTRTNLGLGATNNAFVGLSVGSNNTNLSVENSSAFGLQNFIDSTAEESFAFGAANKITNMPSGAGGSVVMGILGNMTNQGAFLFNGVPQGGLAGNSRGNNTFAVNASNGIYLNGSLFLEGVQGLATDLAILQIAAGGAVTRTMTNKSTGTPAFFGWSGFVNKAFTAGEARTNLELGATNNVIFNQVQVGPDVVFADTGELRWAGASRFSLETMEFYAPFEFDNTTNAAITRTNLGLGWPALTNSNSGTGLVSVNTNGEVVSPTNFWQVAPITTTFIESEPLTNSSTNISGGRFLHIHSLAPAITGVTNTIVLPTNGTAFVGDVALIVHQGPTNSLTKVRTSGSTNDLVTMSRFDETVEFVYYNDQWQFNHNQSFIEPIYFSGTNATANAAASRTNLGIGSGATNTVSFGKIRVPTGELTIEDPVNDASIITFPVDTDPVVLGADYWNHASVRTSIGLPLAALTNTNNANFQAAIFNTNSVPTNVANVNAVNFNTAIHWMEVNVVTNGVTNNFRIPLFK